MCIAILSACGLVSRESVYEGIRQQQQTQTPNQHQDSQSRQLPKYPEYEKERDQLKNKGAQ